jgi:peptidoglycan/xylan/chitin deacetylase (PgdA/CDA1 family)
MSLAKKIARELILPSALRLKFDKILLNTCIKSSCIINFHGVRSNNTPAINNRHITVKEFEKIITYLTKNFNVVPLTQLFEIHRSTKRPNLKTLALTFDDGYKNNFEIALPVLKKYRTPATFYIITKCLDDEDFLAWPEKYELIKMGHHSNIEVNGIVFKQNTLFNEGLNLHLVNYLKTLGNKTESAVNELLEKYSIKVEFPSKYDELFKLITQKELVDFRSEPLLEFGSHTHSHYCLEYLDKTNTEFELFESKRKLEECIGKKINSLAFPDGSYNSETLAMAKKLGYDNLVAVEYKNQEKNQNPNLLSRFTISNSTTFESNMFRFAREFTKYGF